MAGAQSSAVQRTLVSAPPVGPTESKSALPTVQPLRGLSTSAAVPARTALAMRRGAKFPRRSRWRAYGGETFDEGAGASSAGRGWPTAHINPVSSDHNFVRRTYTTAGALQLVNTSGTNYIGRAYSLNFTYDVTANSCASSVYLGSPQAAVGTDTTLQFQNLVDEFQALTNVYRYFRVTKFQMKVSKLPLPTYVASQPVPGVPTNQQQGATWTNMGDPGRMLLRPWTGAPGVANYANGVLTAADWDDHYRYKRKKVESAVGPVSHPLEFCVAPVQPTYIPDGDDDLAVASGQVRYDRCPWIDISDFSTGRVDASSYGMIYYWYFPSCVGATTGFLESEQTFEIEVEYKGLKPPSAYTPGAALPQVRADGSVASDSREALVASLRGVEVKTFDPDPAPSPPVVSLNDLKPPPIDVRDGYVQVSQQAAAAPVVKQGLPGSRPSTPTTRQR